MAVNRAELQRAVKAGSAFLTAMAKKLPQLENWKSEARQYIETLNMADEEHDMLALLFGHYKIGVSCLRLPQPDLVKYGFVLGRYFPKYGNHEKWVVEYYQVLTELWTYEVVTA